MPTGRPLFYYKSCFYGAIEFQKATRGIMCQFPNSLDAWNLYFGRPLQSVCESIACSVFLLDSAEKRDYWEISILVYAIWPCTHPFMATQDMFLARDVPTPSSFYQTKAFHEHLNFSSLD